MDEAPNDIDLIERYLLGKLSGEEVRMVEERLEEDHEFARKCRLIRTFPSMMSEQGRIEYEKQTATQPQNKVEKSSFRFPKAGYPVWAAIAIFVIGIIAFFFFFKSTRHDRQMTEGENPAMADTLKKSEIREPGKQTNPPDVDNPAGAVPEAIELLNPADGMTLSRKEEILFNWKQETDSFSNLYIFSELNDKLILWRGIKPGIREYRVPALGFYPGKFYWFVGTKK